MSDSSLLELLSVTDKAVKSLNKSHSSRSSQSSDVSVTSHRSQTKDSGIKSQTENVDTRADNHGSDLSDVSTTASDVLIRSTIIENEGRDQFSVSGASGDGANDVHNKSGSSSIVDSNKGVEKRIRNESHSSGGGDGAKVSSSESKCSRTSIGVDNFNSSGPQKVKISTKKLREIKSPAGSDSISPRSDVISPPIITHADGRVEKSNIPRDKPLVTRHFSDTNKEQKKQNSKTIYPSSSRQTKLSEDNLGNENDKKFQKPYEKKVQVDSPRTPEKEGSSSYKNGDVFVQGSDKSSSDSHDVIVERHAPKITHPTKERRPEKEQLVDDKEAERLKKKLLELEDSMDFIPQKETGIFLSSSTSACSKRH